jgi:anti-anti-sigma factor
MTSITVSKTELSDAKSGKILVLSVQGEVDTSTSREFKDQVLNLVAAAPGVRQVRLDCAGLVYISSMGVGSIMEIQKQLNGTNIALSIARMAKNIRNVIDILGISSFLNFE